MGGLIGQRLLLPVPSSDKRGGLDRRADSSGSDKGGGLDNGTTTNSRVKKFLL